MFTAVDERAHRPEPGSGWEESWSFDFVAAGGRLAGYARLTLHPAEGRAWWWAAVVGPGRPYVLVREHDVDPPKAPSLEIRASGLWAEPYCEAPFEHWSVGLEAFAVALDDPIEAYGQERGQPVPLGLDLGWETDAEPIATGPTAYRQDCAVHGDVLVGRERLVVDGAGTRAHAWGPPVWGDAEVDGRGLIARPDPVFHAPVQLPGARLARALCRAGDGSAEGDGRLVWVEALVRSPATG